MSFSHFNLEQHETNSHSDYSDQLEKWEQNHQQRIRRNSLPIILEDGEKKLKEKFILSRIDELGLDYNKAVYILDNMGDECIKQNDENVILHRVIQTILLMDSFPKATSKQQQGHYFEQIKELIGKKSPNLFSYLNYQNDRGKQEGLLGLTCAICLNELKIQNIKLDCYHQFCLDCLNNYIVEKINIGQVEEIYCPNYLCKQKLNDEFLESMIDKENINKLYKFRKIKMIQMDQNFIWCPKLGCEEIIRKSKTKNPKCQCGQIICNNCNRKYHRNQSCKAQLDYDFMETAKKFKIQKCNKCKSLIQKNEGCNHIVCQQCKYEFCWLCKSQFTIQHYKFYNIFGCPGMKFSHRDPFQYPNIFRLFRFLIFLVFGIPIFLIGLIIGLIVLSFTLPAIIFMNCVHLHQFKNYHCCKQTVYIIVLLITCILLSPFNLLIVTICFFIGVISGICYIIYIIFKWLIKK